MKGLLYVFALIAVAATAFWAYRVTGTTQEAAGRVSALHRQIAREQEALAILRIEWAYLNAPERLARLVARHKDALALTPLRPDHFAEAGMVAYPATPTLVAEPTGAAR